MFLFFLLYTYSYSQTCEPIQNGRYEVVYDQQFIRSPKFEFKIKDGYLIYK